jgi:hypothetical protein
MSVKKGGTTKSDASGMIPSRMSFAHISPQIPLCPLRASGCATGIFHAPHNGPAALDCAVGFSTSNPMKTHGPGFRASLLPVETQREARSNGLAGNQTRSSEDPVTPVVADDIRSHHDSVGGCPQATDSIAHASAANHPSAVSVPSQNIHALLPSNMGRDTTPKDVTDALCVIDMLDTFKWLDSSVG